MTVETFFKKFELFAEAPNAVEKLRALVLTLAMQGKVVEQCARDGSAIALLERIIATKKPAQKLRKTRRFDRADDFDAPYILPGNWTWTTLGTVAEWGSGSTP